MNPSSPHYNENVMYRNFPNLKEKIKVARPQALRKKLASQVKYCPTRNTPIFRKYYQQCNLSILYAYNLWGQIKIPKHQYMIKEK
jgi:hypothetical protein